MTQKITAECAKKAQVEAEWAYEKAKEKFYYSMLELVFLKIKSHLSEQGLKKVIAMDERRSNNESLSVDFSQKTWLALAESWAEAEGLAMSKIAGLYELEINDMDMSKISPPKGRDCEDNCSCC